METNLDMRIQKSRIALVIFGIVALIGLGSVPASALVPPTVTLNSAGVLGVTGRSVTVSGTYRCDFVPGGTQRLMLKVTQGPVLPPAQAQNIFVVPCTGAVEPYAFTIPTISTNPLVPGPATGQALLTGSSGAASTTTAMVLA